MKFLKYKAPMADIPCNMGRVKKVLQDPSLSLGELWISLHSFGETVQEISV